MMRVKKNDTVLILSGRDKGKRGAVLAVNPKAGKIKVRGIAVVTRHVKATRAGQQGGIKKQEAFIHAAKAMPVCPSCDKPCRVRFATTDTQKTRTCNKCNAAL